MSELLKNSNQFTLKEKIFIELNHWDKNYLSSAIDYLKKEYNLTDTELLPIYNEWFFGKITQK